MRLYLSSYQFGNQPDKLFELLRGEKPKVAIITNAADGGDEARILERLEEQAGFFSKHGFEAERLDLRKYFGKEKELAEKVKEYGLFWVRGGNVFVLRMAMKLSGFDKIIVKKLENDEVVYGGYSAGGCILCPDLNGFDIVDDVKLVEEAYGVPADYSALKILDYYFEPHYKSDHPESADVDKEIAVLESKNLPYKAIRDGQAILIDGNKEELLT